MPDETTAKPLNAIHRQMLEAGAFHLDGWCSLLGHQAAEELEEMGLLETELVRSSSQCTTLSCTVTAAGKQALEAMRHE